MSVEGQEGPVSRPVLTTGTFTANDTAISVGHVLVTFLKKGMHVEEDESVGKAQEELVTAIISTYGTEVIATAYKALNAITIIDPVKEQVDALKTDFYDTFLNPLMGKIANEMQAIMLEQSVGATSLLEVSKNNQNIIDGGTKDPTVVERLTETATKESVADQRKIGKNEAMAREAALAETPYQIKAGPSHSQIDKDHTNSIFFWTRF